MSDEQIIYIGPDDDLTSIRERLEKVPSKQVTLVIPANTQLRSHVAWKLLYVRAREMGKEVLIVSSDAQIRSVAHAVKFRVATSLEASTPAKPRPASRPGRAVTSGRGRATSTGSMRSATGKIDTRGGSSASSTRSRMSNQWYQVNARPDLEAESKPSQPDETITGGLSDQPPKKYGAPSYDFRIDTVPSIHPLPAQQSEEEPDFLLEDFNVARDIREAALGNRQQAGSPSEHPEEATGPASIKNRPSTTPRINLPQIVDDPFVYMDDDQLSPSLPNEQRGSVSIDHFNTNEHEIQDAPDIPTDAPYGKIEYQDGAGAFLPAAQSPAQAEQWTGPEPYDEEEIAGPSSSYNVRPHSSRLRGSGNMAPLPSRPVDDEQEKDALPPVEDQPTRVMSSDPTPMSPRPAQKAGTSARRSVPLQGEGSPRRSTPLQPGAPARRSVPLQGEGSPRRSTPLQPAARDRAAQASQSAQPGASRTSQKPTRPGASRQVRHPVQPRRAITSTSGHRNIILIAVLVVLVVLVGALALFVPTANVVLTLQSRSYSHTLSLVARSSIQQNSAPGIVAAQLQTHSFTQNGTATATGSKRVGKDPATGSVTFTNNGKQPVTIPTGTIVSTPSGIQFVTGAELLVNIPGSTGGNQVPVPVQAVVKGDNGNLPAETITVISQDSLNAIARDNNLAASDLALQVSNPLQTTGGGLGTVHIIQQQDLDIAKKTVGAQLQPDINTWLKQWTTDGVSSKPTTSATLVGSPQSGQTVNNVVVPITLSITVAVLVVRNNDLQKAAATQLDAFMKNDANYRNYLVPADVQQAVKIDMPKLSSNDATSLTISGNGMAQVVPAIAQDEIRKEVAGMPIKSAQAMLSRQPGIERVDISIAPSFIPWLPYWAANTRVILQAGTAPTK